MSSEGGSRRGKRPKREPTEADIAISKLWHEIESINGAIAALERTRSQLQGMMNGLSNLRIVEKEKTKEKSAP